jgi:F0F1-type ATP synthase assembly protein I
MAFKKPDPREVGYYFALSQVGLEMAAPIALGVLADIYLGWMPWGIIVGAIFGLVGGFAHLISMLNQRNKDQAEKKKRDAE